MHLKHLYRPRRDSRFSLVGVFTSSSDSGELVSTKRGTNVGSRSSPFKGLFLLKTFSGTLSICFSGTRSITNGFFRGDLGSRSVVFFAEIVFCPNFFFSGGGASDPSDAVGDV